MRCDVADQLDDVLGVGSRTDRGHLDGCLAHEDRKILTLLGQNHGDHVAGAACASGATTAVQVSLVLGRRIDVDDQLDFVDVDATRCDVGGDEDARFTGGECRQVTVASSLREVAVKVNGRDARLGELASQLASLVLGAHEQDATTGTGSELLDQSLLGFDAVDVEHVVRHCGDGGVGLVDRMHDLVLEETLDELVDAVVQRCREQ